MSQTEKPRKPASRSKTPNLKLRVKTQEEKRLELRNQCLVAELEDVRKELKESEFERGKLTNEVKLLRISTEAHKKVEEQFLDENRKLRGMVHDGELAYAKLFGYVERIRDEQPPVMVPQQRESLLATMPDGTQGFDMSRHVSRDYDFNRQEPKRWYER